MTQVFGVDRRDGGQGSIRVLPVTERLNAWQIRATELLPGVWDMSGLSCHLRPSWRP